MARSGSEKSGSSPRVAASNVVRDTPIACASGHSAASHCANAASAAKLRVALANGSVADNRSDESRKTADASFGQVGRNALHLIYKSMAPLRIAPTSYELRRIGNTERPVNNSPRTREHEINQDLGKISCNVNPLRGFD